MKQLTYFISALALLLTGCEFHNPLAKKAPILLVKSDYKPGEITELCTAAIKTAEDRLNQVGQLNATQRQVGNTLLAMEDTLADLGDQTNGLTFMGYVSTDEAISKEGSDCEENLGQFYVTIGARRDLYQSVANVKGRNKEEARLLKKTIDGFEQSGLKLADDQLAKLTELKKLLSEKENQFSTNLNQDKSSVTFSAEELPGATASFLARLKKTEDGKLIVTTKSTDYLELMQNVTNADARKKMMLAYQNRGGAANVKLLEEATQLRDQIAKILGFATHADARIANRMAKTSKTVLDFLGGLKGKLALRNQADLAQLLKFKQEMEPTATVVNQWDIAYLSYQLQKRDFQLDNEEIRQYFPADVVVAGMFEVYSKILGVSYHEVKDAKVWAPEVKLYEIRNQGSSKPIAYFYADFFPRAGKYGHAAAFTLVSGRRLENGAYNYPVSSIVANFSPPSDGKPSLLTHDEVETIFHEFGHIMHQTLTRVPYASLSGSSTARDFVEAPSQMLENWVWAPEVLSLLSGHYLNNNQKLPAEILQRMLSVKDYQLGAGYTKQLLYASFDMSIHTQQGAVDVTETYDSMYRSIVGAEPIAGGHFAGTFGHMMGGYDAGYYGYLWSEVYAQDMFTKFKDSGDLLSPVVGAKYRKAVLERGDMVDAIDLLRDFLGREPNSKAFFAKLGIND